GPEPGRTEAPYWVKTEAEARKDVQELAQKKVDLVKIWVDDRDHTVAKLSPALYTAIIDEAHKHNLRTIAHIFTLEDAKGVLRAGIDAFAHSVRDKDIDDEFVNMMKAKPNMIVDPNLPDRGVKVDRSWLRESMTAEGRMPWARHEGMGAMVGSGITPAQGLVVSNRNAAEPFSLKE